MGGGVVSDGFYTYRCYDERGRIIYIGFTGNPTQRERGHKQESPWWGDVDDVIYAMHPTEDEARRVEWAMIQTFNPINNKVGTAGFVPGTAGAGPNYDKDGHCDWPGCGDLGNDVDGRTLCGEHRRAYRRRQRGDQNSSIGRRPLTEAEWAEIRRRLARFENPGDIARDLGVSRNTVLRARKVAS